MGGNNSYKNIVATSYNANSLKNNKCIDDFIRELYKSDLISLTEFNELKKKIGNLQEGKLAPSKASIKSALLNKFYNKEILPIFSPLGELLYFACPKKVTK